MSVVCAGPLDGAADVAARLADGFADDPYADRFSDPRDDVVDDVARVTVVNADTLPAAILQMIQRRELPGIDVDTGG